MKCIDVWNQKRKFILICVFVLCFMTKSVSAQTNQENEALVMCEDNRNVVQGDRGVPIQDLTRMDQPVSFHRVLTLGTIRFYQKVISPSHGMPCPMYPSCSRYGFQAFQAYNPLKAFIMTADRLQRCGHDLGNYELIKVDEGGMRYQDPVLQSINTELSKSPNSISLANEREQVHNFDIFTGASSTSTTEDKRVFTYAKRLEQYGDYAGAIKEYKRLISYYPDSNFYKEAVVAIFNCYYKSGQYLTAVNWGESLLTKYPDLPGQSEIQFFIGVCFYKLSNYKVARSYFEILKNRSIGEIRAKSQLLIGLSYAVELNWSAAYEEFEQVDPNSPFASNARDCKKLAREVNKIKFKNPKIAGILSIIPGAGYLYCGYKQTALSAFLVNGMFIKSTGESIERGDKGLSAILGTLCFGWYAGNIYGAVNSAERKNLYLIQNHLAKFDIGFTF